MKNKLTLVLVAGLGFAGTQVFAAGTVRENCGCGLGSMALGDETGMVSHVVGATLNGISGNQTFAVSSGTLNCDQSEGFVSTKEVEMFVADNMDHIASNAAVGEGAYLSALADLLEINEADRADFYASMQMNFDKIFVDSDVHADEVTRSIVALI
ncbi:DUF3015 family protein [Kiritimatiellaeota bacterium B1221]|nr:DUF3015 family protein [Kiritimatiellaeota bacterium B1221]